MSAAKVMVKRCHMNGAQEAFAGRSGAIRRVRWTHSDG